jgi:hypothetical protein
MCPLRVTGTGTVKYTTPLPCIGLIEGDSKLIYTNFEFCEGKNNEHLKNKLELSFNLT